MMSSVKAPKQQALNYIWDESIPALVSVERAMPKTADQAQALRRQLAEAYRAHRSAPGQVSALWCCPICWDPLVLAGRPNGQGFYVRHRQNPDFPCPHKNGSCLSLQQWDALRFNGQKESLRHIRLKERIGAMLADWKATESVTVEPTVRGIDKLSWRRPDILATFLGHTVAIEIQLSSTYLDVIVAREAFYRDNGTTVLWIFDRLTEHGHRLYEKDIYFHHNGNAFELTDQALSESQATGVPHLTCHYRAPVLEQRNIRIEWRERIVPLSEITFCTKTFRVFWYDYDAVLADLQAHLALSESLELLRSVICLDATVGARSAELHAHLKHAALVAGISSPVPEPDTGAVRIFEVIVSAQTGRFVGELGASRGCANWPFWANVIFEHYPGYAKAFLRVAEHYQFTDEFDHRSVWRKKKRLIAQRRRRGEIPERTYWWPIFQLLAPEVTYAID